MVVKFYHLTKKSGQGKGRGEWGMGGGGWRLSIEPCPAGEATFPLVCF